MSCLGGSNTTCSFVSAIELPLSSLGGYARWVEAEQDPGILRLMSVRSSGAERSAKGCWPPHLFSLEDMTRPRITYIVVAITVSDQVSTTDNAPSQCISKAAANYNVDTQQTLGMYIMGNKLEDQNGVRYRLDRAEGCECQMIPRVSEKGQTMPNLVNSTKDGAGDYKYPPIIQSNERRSWICLHWEAPDCWEIGVSLELTSGGLCHHDTQTIMSNERQQSLDNGLD
ncbi:uncharacterized protein EI90DRAFT_3017403 [Cantharellus anzutake]|uniref:uncharacterized protein n=1 Tax=Cantharellus anzutake TaxID=1750568 RepID=UPI0019077F3B|nr:uncharacterized protein EI90DRAFT_3017403 [Cantharellus anzutake]KAF8329168.1 hypothetical protein EI90DRAFT_3017403 [Cantharellus anzutake]